MAAAQKKRTSVQKKTGVSANNRKQSSKPQETQQKTAEVVAAQLSALGCDPIQGMAEIAMDKENAASLRAGMFKELAQYMVAKPRAGTELPGGTDDTDTIVDAPLDLSKLSSNELREIKSIVEQALNRRSLKKDGND